MGNRIFISYKNDNDSIISGYVTLIEKTINYVIIETAGNKITLPWSRILKIKEAV